MAKISINLVTWNGERYLDACLRSVLAQTFQDFSILIIDNGSTDGTKQFLKENYPQIRVVEHRENLGFAKAHNQAIHWTKGEFILCLNQDVMLAPNFLADTVALMEREPMCGAVTGKLLRWQDGEKTHYVDSVGIKLFKNFRAIDIGAGEMDQGQFDNAEQVFGVSGAAPLYRRKALEETCWQDEYFDESFFSYKEDVDLAFRLRLAAWTAWRSPLAVAYHDRSVSAERNSSAWGSLAKNRRHKSRFAKFYAYRNQLFFAAKSLPPFKQYWAAWLPVIWFELAKLIYVAIFETKNLRALADLRRQWKILKNKREVAWKNRKIEWPELSKWL